MTRRELLTKVAPVGVGAGFLLMALPGCSGKKKEEPPQNKQEEEQYYKQEEGKAKSDEANEQ